VISKPLVPVRLGRFGIVLEPCFQRQNAWLPRRVVWGAVDKWNFVEMTMKSSEVTELKSDFHRDGFVIVRGFISPVVLTELQERAQSAVQCLDSKYKKHGLP
ncbi:uncharacterized protein METZ01_LOCUS377352, partial [marine metagenome]